jgi:lysozyme
MSPEGQREVFDLHFKNIQNSKIKDSQKLILQENLFKNIPHPDGFNFEEYVESRMPTRTERLGLGIAKGLLNPVNKPGAIAQQVIKAFGEDVQSRPTKKLNSQTEKVSNLKSNTSTDSKVLEKEKEKLFEMQIKQSDNLIVKKLLNDEGYRTNVYEDSEGILTAGMGHKLTDEEKEIYKKGDYVPTDVVQKWTQNDINKFSNITNEVMEDKGLLNSELYKQNEEMFVSFFFQLGKDGGLAFTKMWDAIDRGDAKAAHDEALDSLWAKQTPKRAKRFAKMLLENV